MHNCPGVCSKIVLRKIGKHFSLKNKGIWGGGIDICGKNSHQKDAKPILPNFARFPVKFVNEVLIFAPSFDVN